jgi:hypothetical protein
MHEQRELEVRQARRRVRHLPHCRCQIADRRKLQQEDAGGKCREQKFGNDPVVANEAPSCAQRLDDSRDERSQTKNLSVNSKLCIRAAGSAVSERMDGGQTS